MPRYKVIVECSGPHGNAAQKPLTPERCWTQARSTTTTTKTATGNVAARSTWERTEERTDETKNQI